MAKINRRWSGRKPGVQALVTRQHLAEEKRGGGRKKKKTKTKKEKEKKEK